MSDTVRVKPSALSVLFLASLALIAFAANSVLARLALIDGAIGPLGFTTLRILSGAVFLVLLVGLRRARIAGNWAGALALLGYALFFSLAYLSLPAGTGALILFAMVQITMLGVGLITGERLRLLQWFGAALAVMGLIYLLSPGIAAPDPLGALAMGISGICWGAYSLLGRGGSDPTAQTAGNFARAAFVVAVMVLPIYLLLPEAPPRSEGVLYALLSGVITSGLGYAIWYRALKSITAIRAGLAQLSVPVIAAFGGILFLSEPLTLRFTLSTLIIFAGLGLALFWPQKAR